MKWFYYTRGTIPLHRLACALLSVHKLASKLNGIKFENVLCINEGPEFWWAWSDKEIKDLGRNILKKCGKKSSWDKHYQNHQKYNKRAIFASEKIRKKDLKKFDNDGLIDLYDFLFKESAPAHALTDPDIDAIDIVFEDFLQKKMEKELRPKISRNEFLYVYQKLSRPLYQSFITRQEKEIIKLSLKNKASSDDISKICNKYWWTKLGWENMTPYKKEDFQKFVKRYKKDKNAEAKLEKIEEDFKRIKRQRDKIIKEYKLSKDLVYWLNILDKYTYLHDLRKEMQMKTTYAFYLLMSETADKLNLIKDDLEWFWFEEIKHLLLGKKFEKEEIKRRKKATFVKVSKKSIITWSGKEALLQHKKVMPKAKKIEEEIKGVGATSEKVKGIAKVCSGAEEASKKVKKGDVLVCGMTLPDYLPSMKRASAIVTNEGGITCHAAIIARELNKPCVVGTKIATQALKDGDLVEVDSDSGIVRKL